MKNLKILLIGMLFSIYGNAQMPDFDCPPDAWCHPDGSGLGLGFNQKVLDAATAVGKAMQNDPCGDQDYATQVYCYLGEALSKIIACGYGKDTPQYEMCDEEESESTSLSPAEKKKIEAVKGDAYSLSSGFRPAIIHTKSGTKPLVESLEKLKRGEVIKKYETGQTLSLLYKFYDTEGKGHGAVFYLTNKKGERVSTLLMLTKNGDIYLVEVTENKKGKGK